MGLNQILHVRAAGGTCTENCVQRARGSSAKPPCRNLYLTYHQHQEDLKEPPDKDKRSVRKVEVAIRRFTPFYFSGLRNQKVNKSKRSPVTDSGHRPSRHLITRETSRAICLCVVRVMLMDYY